MERAIKFRALVQYKGKEPMWIYYKPLTIPHAFYEDTTDCKIIVKDLQFTGLLDKHGVEIYEGDFVIKDNPKRPKKDHSLKPHRVKWRTDTCGFNVADPKYQRPPWTYEIVGNIYETQKS